VSQQTVDSRKGRMTKRKGEEQRVGRKQEGGKRKTWVRQVFAASEVLHKKVRLRTLVVQRVLNRDEKKGKESGKVHQERKREAGDQIEQLKGQAEKNNLSRGDHSFPRQWF